jgi:hypothetical protein
MSKNTVSTMQQFPATHKKGRAHHLMPDKARGKKKSSQFRDGPGIFEANQ